MTNNIKRPNYFLFLVGSLFLSIPCGLILAAIFPEGSALKVAAGILGIVIPPAGVAIYSRKKLAEFRLQLLKKYEDSKNQLRRNASSQNAREAMLNAGRAYYGSLREDGLPTTYDEQAINNDISAITGR